MSEEERRPGFATRAIHGARSPHVEQDPASVPIYQTSTWRFDTSEDYAEVINFRRHGYVYASGMAAVHATVTTYAKAGDRVVSSTELYGGSYSLFHSVLPRYGVEVTYVSPHDVEAVAAALPGAKLFYVETIANPNCTVADLAALATRCREAGVPAAVDNTFVSPYLCNPAALGFDVVLHSATKYVGGHSDLIGGV